MENSKEIIARLETELKEWKNSAKDVAEALADEMNPPKGHTGAFNARVRSHDSLKKFKELNNK